MSTEDNAPEDGQGSEPLGGDVKPAAGDLSTAERDADLVERDFDRIFAGRPLLGSAWAAQLDEQLRATASWPNLQDTIAKMQDALLPHFSVPTGLLNNLEAAVFANVAVIHLDTGEILATNTIQPDKTYWRNNEKQPGRWPGSDSPT